MLTPEEIQEIELSTGVKLNPDGSQSGPSETATEGSGRKSRGALATGAGVVTRLGGGVISSIVGAVPSFITTPAAAAIGGATEALAQKIEGEGPINKSRVLLEAGLSAVPMGKVFKAGDFVRKNMLRGALFAEAGNIGRRYDEKGEFLPSSLGEAGWDAASIGLGALGGKLTPGKNSGAAAAVVDDLEVPPGDPLGDALLQRLHTVTEDQSKIGRLIHPTGRYMNPEAPATFSNPELVKRGRAVGVITKRGEPTGPPIPSNSLSYEDAAPIAPNVAQKQAELMRKPNITASKTENLAADGVVREPRAHINALDEEIARSNKMADAQRKAHEITRKQEIKLQNAERTAELQDLRSRKGGTDLEKIRTDAEKAQAIAIKDAAKAEAADLKTIVEKEKAHAVAIKDAEKISTAQEKAHAAALALREAEKQRDEAQKVIDNLISEGATPGPVTVTETSVKVPTSSGNQVIRQTLREKIEEEGGEEAGKAAGKTPPPPVDPLKPLKPEVVAMTMYPNEPSALRAIAATGVPGVAKRMGRGKWQAVFTTLEGETPKPVAPTAPEALAGDAIVAPKNIAPPTPKPAAPVAPETLATKTPAPTTSLDAADVKPPAPKPPDVTPPDAPPTAMVPAVPKPKPPTGGAPAKAETPVGTGTRSTGNSATDARLRKEAQKAVTKTGKVTDVATAGQKVAGRSIPEGHTVVRINSGMRGSVVEWGIADSNGALIIRSKAKEDIWNKLDELNGQGKTPPPVTPRVAGDDYEIPYIGRDNAATNDFLDGVTPIKGQTQKVNPKTSWQESFENSTSAEKAEIASQETGRLAGKPEPPEPPPAPAPVPRTPVKPTGGAPASAEAPKYTHGGASAALDKLKQKRDNITGAGRAERLAKEASKRSRKAPEGEAAPKADLSKPNAAVTVKEAAKAAPEAKFPTSAYGTIDDAVIEEGGKAKNPIILAELDGAATAGEVKNRLLFTLQSYVKKADEIEALRGVNEKGMPTGPTMGAITIEVPNGPTIKVDPQQAKNLIARIEANKVPQAKSGEGRAMTFKGDEAWQGIVDAPAPRPTDVKMKVEHGTNFNAKGDGGSAPSYKIPLPERRSRLTPEQKGAAIKQQTDDINKIPKNHLDAKFTGGDVDYKGFKLRPYDIGKEKRVQIVKGDNASQTISNANTLEEAKAMVDRGDAAKWHHALYGDYITDPPKGGLKVGKPKAAEETLKAEPTTDVGKATAAVKPKAMVDELDEKLKDVRSVTPLPKSALPSKQSAEVTEAAKETRPLAQLIDEEKQAWDQYWKLKKEGASNDEVRAAGKAAGELKAAIAKTATAELGPEAANKMLAERTRADLVKYGKPEAPKAPAGKGPTNEDIAKMSPEDQTKTLTEIVAKVKKQGKRGLKNQKGIAANELMQSLGMGAVGAVAGSMTSDDPVIGGLIGFGSGFFAPSAVRAAIHYLDGNENLRGSALNKARKDVADKVKDTFKNYSLHMLPDAYRASLLTGMPAIPINAWVGPYGSSLMAAIEHTMGGDPRGLRALKELSPVQFLKEYKKSWNEAAELIKSSHERTEGVIGKEGPLWFRKAVSVPAQTLTAGDLAARNLLKRAGFSDEEARIITLTSEPFSGWGGAIGAFRKKKSELTGKPSLLANMVLPFYKTNVNQLEQGLIRLPFAGPLLRKHWNYMAPSVQQEVAQQIISGSAAGVSFAIGYGMADRDPWTIRQTLKIINNFGGQYGASSALGFIAGQAYAKGDNPWTAVATGFVRRDMPVPNADAIWDVGKVIKDVSEGKTPRLPAGLPVPPVAKDAFAIGKGIAGKKGNLDQNTVLGKVERLIGADTAPKNPGPPKSVGMRRLERLKRQRAEKRKKLRADLQGR